MSSPGYFPGGGAGLSQGQVDARIAAAVPPLIPPATSRRVWSQQAVQPGDNLTNTSTLEQTFASRATIPAPLVMGETLRLHGGGVFTTSTLLTPTQRARIRWGVGGPVIMDTSTLGLLVGAASGRYIFDVNLIVRSLGTAGTVESSGSIKFANAAFGTTEALCGPSGQYSEIGNPVTVDTTQPVDLALSVTFSSTQTGNANTLRWSVLHDLRPAS